MGIFKDKNGKRVRAGDTVLIETTYSGSDGQGQKCLVVWDEKTGRYLYKHKIKTFKKTVSALEDFVCVVEFVKVNDDRSRNH